MISKMSHLYFLMILNDSCSLDLLFLWKKQINKLAHYIQCPVVTEIDYFLVEALSKLVFILNTVL